MFDINHLCVLYCTLISFDKLDIHIKGIALWELGGWSSSLNSTPYVGMHTTPPSPLSLHPLFLWHGGGFEVRSSGRVTHSQPCKFNNNNNVSIEINHIESLYSVPYSTHTHYNFVSQYICQTCQTLTSEVNYFWSIRMMWQ